MGFLDKIFKKKESGVKAPKGFELYKVTNIQRETDKAVAITFAVPEALQSQFSFVPGQYVNFSIPINGKEERRSYSICSLPSNSSFTVAVKEVENGTVSKFMNRDLKEEDELFVSFPEGNFKLSDEEGVYVGIAGGSGITPILSMIETIAQRKDNSKFILLYGNYTEADIIFKNRLETLEKEGFLSVVHFLSEQEKEGTINGMIDQKNFTDYIKNSLPILQSNAFYICGPEGLMINAKEVLSTFGVKEEKIKYELFTAPTQTKDTGTNITVTPETFKGKATVKVILDEEETSFQLKSSGKTILSGAMHAGLDVPYSCQGGVCCTCKAKVLEGRATMTQNYALTDEEVSEGYILTCQSHPQTETLTVSYDE